MTPAEILKSPLHDRHVALEARMGHEGQWEVPLSYGRPLEEALEARRRAVVADVSQGGRIRIRGNAALGLLERVCTAAVATQEDNTVILTALCNEQGGMIDLCELVRLEDHWLLATSASARLRVLEHLALHAEGLDVKLQDQTLKTAQIAVLGPAAAGILDAVLPLAASQVPDGGVVAGSMLIASYTAWRTSPAGGWGVQVMLPAMLAGKAWDYIVRRAGDTAVRPAGVVALDVLRIEAGLPRHGREFNETVDPVTAGVQQCVDWGHDFVGKAALQQVRSRGPARLRVGLVLQISAERLPSTDPGAAGRQSLRPYIPRQGAMVLDVDGAEVGTVTSGTFSPALDSVIAMAYVSPRLAAEGQTVKVVTEAGTLAARVRLGSFL